MTNAKAHYDAHLGPVYSWMAGDFAALRERSAALFDRLGLVPRPAAPGAVDLGAGHGAQSVALADRGFAVTAIDFCDTLLDELRANAAGMNVHGVHADIGGFSAHTQLPVGAVVCMGDTLVHLPDRVGVEKLVRDVADALVDGGTFVATFRDYVTREPRGNERFIPVRASDDTILTCFLEYGEDTVTVHDLLHRRVDGRWHQTVSSYPKLRLDPAWLGEVCRQAGMTVRECADADGGMIVFVADRRCG